MQSSNNSHRPTSLLGQHYAYPHYRLVVFAKAPVLGFAKTRLQPQLPQAFSLALHSRLTAVALNQWSQSNICPIECWIAGDKQVFSEKILGCNPSDLTNLAVYQQAEGSLGERLINAINCSFSNDTSSHQKQKSQDIQGVFVVGTDCPFIDKSYLLMACEALAKHDVVIGPADDGGYVLLGLKVPNESLFTDIRWGESSVFASTIAKLKSSKLSYFELPSLSDIDQPQDLAKLKVHGEFDDLLEQANTLTNNGLNL